jgi:hypothetical protein
MSLPVGATAVVLLKRLNYLMDLDNENTAKYRKRFRPEML